MGAKELLVGLLTANGAWSLVCKPGICWTTDLITFIVFVEVVVATEPFKFSDF
jgi:hypothetical protein